MTKRMCFIGNCQVMGLCDYIANTPDQPNCRWLCTIDKWHTESKWPKCIEQFGQKQIDRNIFDKKKILELLIHSDYVIYQPNFYHNQTVNIALKKNTHLIPITLSPIFVNDLQYIIKKEKKYNCNILCSEIIKNNKDHKLYINRDNHPTTFLLLEIAKQICDITKISFYTNNDYEKLLKVQYPNYLHR